MFMPKKDRIAIYAALFSEGVLVAQKQPGGNYKDHKYITREVTDSEGNTKVLQVANIFVKDAMKSLLSRGYVREIFNWQWHYYFLTDAGIEYLRQYLHLEEHVVPATMKKTAKPAGIREGEERRFGRGGFDKEKGVGAPGDFRPRYRREERPAAAAAAPAAAETA